MNSVKRSKYFQKKYYFDKVEWGKKVDKQLSRLPVYVRSKFYAWAQFVELVGLETVRQGPGYHDEPLKGKRVGQRSIRLSRSYRAIYEEHQDGSVRLVEVVEVNKHDY